MAEKQEKAGRIQHADEFFSAMKQMYERSEEQWSKIWEQTLTSEAYANLMGLTGTQTMFLKEAMQRNAENVLTTAHMPSREDLANVTRQVIQTEEKVDDLTFKTEDLTDTIQESVVTRLDQFSQQLADMQKTLSLVLGTMNDLGQRLNLQDSAGGRPKQPQTSGSGEIEQEESDSDGVTR